MWFKRFCIGLFSVKAIKASQNHNNLEDALTYVMHTSIQREYRE